MPDATQPYPQTFGPIALRPLPAGVVPGPKAWANRLIAMHGAGEKVNPTALAMAKRALGQPDGT